MKPFRCTFCSYLCAGAEPPATCPRCGGGGNPFVPAEQPLVGAWHCTVCGYLHEGEAPPDVCPVCGVGPDMFEPAE
jgi:rubrerythrin